MIVYSAKDFLTGLLAFFCLEKQQHYIKLSVLYNMMRLGMHPVLLYPCLADRNISLLEIHIILLLAAEQLSGNMDNLFLREPKPQFAFKVLSARSKGTIHPHTEP